MTKQFLMCTVVCILTCGCQKEGRTIAEPNQPPQLSAEQIEILALRGQEKVSIEQAQQQALDAAVLFDADKTRASSRSVGKVDFLLNDKPTRSGNAPLPDTLFYVVNFADDAGFSIVSADKRVDGVFAFIPEGHMRTDTIDNPGMAIFLGMLEDYAAAEIERTSKTQDSLLALYPQLADDPVASSGATRASSTYDVAEPWVNSIFYGPYTTPNWGQRKPYNNKCPSECLAGCVAIATAQAVALFNKPTTHNGHTYDWDNIWAYETNKYALTTEQRAAAEDDIATLVRRIGDLVNMDYGKDKSSANTQKVEKCLETLGFNSGNYTSYDKEAIAASLKDGLPVICDGYSHKKTTLGIATYSKGHAWVIDGFVRQLQVINSYYTDTGRLASTKTDIRNFFHCNWGWTGGCNGFFRNMEFDPYNDAAHFDDEIYEAETRGTTGREYYYQYKLKVIKYIRPKS